MKICAFVHFEPEPRHGRKGGVSQQEEVTVYGIGKARDCVYVDPRGARRAGSRGGPCNGWWTTCTTLSTMFSTPKPPSACLFLHRMKGLTRPNFVYTLSCFVFLTPLYVLI